MNLRFWKKDENNKEETVIEVKSYEGGVTGIYVKAQSKESALELFKQLRDESKERR